MRELKKSICIRLNRTELNCLSEMASDTGETNTALATRLVVDALANFEKVNQLERQLQMHERKLVQTMFAMFSAIAQYDDNAQVEFRQRCNSILTAKVAQK
jgi:hypothetical protein